MKRISTIIGIVLTIVWVITLVGPSQVTGAGILFITAPTTSTPTPTLTPTPTATPTLTPTPTATPTPTTEQVYYLSGIGQSTGYYLPNSTTYGQVGLAGRVGWAWIQPKNTGAYTWTIVDDFQIAAHAANGFAGAPWSLSISAGAYSPLWMFNTGGSFPCPLGVASNRGSAPSNDPPSPSGTLQAFQFTWNVTYVFPHPSVQCAPVPWDPNFKTAWQTLINAAAAHAAPGVDHFGNPYPTLATDPLLDHVVINGINSFTQELWLPYCSTHSSTCGVGSTDTDLSNWAAILTAPPINGTCNGTSNNLSSCPALDDASATDFTTLIQTTYTDIAGYWATAFPTKKLAVMYVDSQSFPFQAISGSSYPSATALKMLNHTASLYPTRSILMTNAVTGTSPYYVYKIRCYTPGAGLNCQPPPPGFVQPSATIAGQEGAANGLAGYPSCSTLSTLTTMLTQAFSPIESQYTEVYDGDARCLP